MKLANLINQRYITLTPLLKEFTYRRPCMPENLNDVIDKKFVFVSKLFVPSFWAEGVCMNNSATLLNCVLIEEEINQNDNLLLFLEEQCLWFLKQKQLSQLCIDEYHLKGDIGRLIAEIQRLDQDLLLESTGDLSLILQLRARLLGYKGKL